MTFITKLSKDECLRRIKENNIERKKAKWAILTMSQDLSKCIYYEIKGDTIKIEKYAHSQNVSNPTFVGRLKTHNSGTIIEGSFTTSILLRGILVLWFSLLILMFLGYIYSQMQSEFKGNMTGFIAFPLMLGFGIYISMSMNQQALEYKKAMITFIENRLEAKRES